MFEFKRVLHAATVAAVVAAAAMVTVAAPAFAQANDQFISILSYRVGPYGPAGTGIFGGFIDYLSYVNAKEGGVGGVKLTWEECETEYQAARGVECYERLKTKSPSKGTMIHPVSTPITYALLDKSVADKVPLVQTGYGRTDTIDGRYFPWAFPLITTYPMQATAIVKYIGQKEKGDLRGKKIAFLYHDSAYGKEPIIYLQAESKVYGFDLTTVPIAPPGSEQGAQWQQIRQSRADWVIFWGFGVMNQAALKAAQKIGFPRDRMIGSWWAGSEEDTVPAGDAAKGYLSAAMNVSGKTPLIADIARWRAAPHRALRSPAARAAFEALLPALVTALAAATDPVQAAARFDSFLAQLPAGLQFFALLEANPMLLPLFGHLLGVTPVLADALARRPALFDVLLADDSFAPLPDARALTAELAALASANLEETLDRVRAWTAERRFQLGAQLIEQRADPLRVARDLAALADAALDVLTRAVTAEFAASHGSIDGGRLVVVALGRYGGRALTHASDLDLVYLFTGPYDAVSDGAKPLAATLYFARLTQRLTAALSVPTASGALYDVDTRLRPSGAKGLLAVSIDSFARYQSDEAWTWEHMALTRARVVIGTADDRAAVEAVVAAVMAQPRDAAALRRDVLAMRADIAAAKPGRGLWDVKLGAGGLVDLEFIVHYRQLLTGLAPTPELGPACIAAGVPALMPVHDLLTRLLVVLRLTVTAAPGSGAPFPIAVRDLLTAAGGFADFTALESALTAAKAEVRANWHSVFGVARQGDKA